MADNVQITAGSGTTIATDDVGGVQYPRGKVCWGADGVATDVSAADPLPVQVSGEVEVSGPLTDTELRATPLAVVPSPATSGGASCYHLVSAASTNAAVVKASPGQLYGYALFNTAAEPRTVKLYDQATAPTVGTDTPALSIVLPPGGGANLAIDVGVEFTAGIALAITKGASDSDATAVAAGDVVLSLFHS